MLRTSRFSLTHARLDGAGGQGSSNSSPEEFSDDIMEEGDCNAGK